MQIKPHSGQEGMTIMKWEVKLEHLGKGEIGKERVVPVIVCEGHQICEMTQLIHLDAPESIAKRQAYARRIVQAVNSFDGLVEALKFLQPLAIKHAPNGIDSEYWKEAFEKLEQALAQAKE